MSESVIKYALTLESRQFLSEMSRARREATAAARQMGDAGKEPSKALAQLGGEAKGAGDLMRGFSSASAALSRALAGDFVGATSAAAGAVKALTAALLTNPWFALSAAVIAVAYAVAKAAGNWIEYKARVREAEEENVKFARSLADIASKWERAGDWKAFEKKLEKSDGETIQRAIEGQERAVERAWDRAIAASRDVRNAKTKGLGQGYIEDLEARRDRAKDNYVEQLGRLGQYREFLEGFHERQERQRGANKEELDRRAEVKAGDDVLKLMEVLKDRRVEASRTWGGGEKEYEKRLEAGTATEEEIRARREIETLEKRILGIAHQRLEEARQLEKVERERAEAAAKADETAAEAARAKLTRSREDALVRAGRSEELDSRADRLEARADEKFGKWSPDRIMKASQEELTARAEVERVRGLAEQARKQGGQQQEQERPWAEGVVAARGMSIGDVFNNMRGMNGASIEKDPTAADISSTAHNTATMALALSKIASAVAGDGVQ